MSKIQISHSFLYANYPFGIPCEGVKITYSSWVSSESINIYQTEVEVTLRQYSDIAFSEGVTDEAVDLVMNVLTNSIKGKIDSEFDHQIAKAKRETEYGNEGGMLPQCFHDEFKRLCS